jgi:hypothetical protein
MKTLRRILVFYHLREHLQKNYAAACWNGAAACWNGPAASWKVPPRAGRNQRVSSWRE